MFEATNQSIVGNMEGTNEVISLHTKREGSANLPLIGSLANSLTSRLDRLFARICNDNYSKLPTAGVCCRFKLKFQI